MTSFIPFPADPPVSKPFIVGLLILLAAATVTAQVPTNPSQLPANLGPTLCPPSSVNPCAALGMLPPISTVLPPVPSQPPCPPLPVNPCTVTNVIGCLPPPFAPNDCFDIPTLVKQSPYNATQNFGTATIEPAEKFACANFFGTSVASFVRHSVWYRFIPVEPGTATVHAGIGTTLWTGPPGITVYTGSSLEAAKKIACNDKGGNGGLPGGDAKFKCVPGTPYHIQVWGFGPEIAQYGDISFNIKGCEGPATIDLNPVVQAFVPCVPSPAPPGTCPGASLPPLPLL